MIIYPVIIHDKYQIYGASTTVSFGSACVKSIKHLEIKRTLKVMIPEMNGHVTVLCCSANFLFTCK